MESSSPTSTNPVIQVLLIEDNPDDVALVEAALGNGTTTTFSVSHANSLAGGLELLDSRPADVVLLDLGLPDSQGIETLRRVLQQFPRVPIVVLTGLIDEALGMHSVKIGAQDFLTKKHLLIPTAAIHPLRGGAQTSGRCIARVGTLRAHRRWTPFLRTWRFLMKRALLSPSTEHGVSLPRPVRRCAAMCARARIILPRAMRQSVRGLETAMALPRIFAP